MAMSLMCSFFGRPCTYMMLSFAAAGWWREVYGRTTSLHSARCVTAVATCVRDLCSTWLAASRDWSLIARHAARVALYTIHCSSDCSAAYRLRPEIKTVARTVSSDNTVHKSRSRYLISLSLKVLGINPVRRGTKRGHLCRLVLERFPRHSSSRWESMRTDEIYIYCTPSFVFGLCPWISPSAQWELAKLILRDIPPRTERASAIAAGPTHKFTIQRRTLSVINWPRSSN